MFTGIKRGIPFVLEREQWTIAVWKSANPFAFDPAENTGKPVLTAEDVTDVRARFVADPFLIRRDNTWYLFFEVYNWDTEQGDIAFATSQDAKKWQYGRVILDEPFHLSYPYTFEWQGEYYMIPESYEAGSVRLYRATDFPTEWALESTLIADRELVDPSVAYFRDKWWLLAATTDNSSLRLFFADELTGDWQEHPMSPVVSDDQNIARPGGRLLVHDDKMYRYTQDADPTYGNQVWALEITEVSESTYEERLVSNVPVVQAGGSGWRGKAMHQIDPVQIVRW